jgi:hypothetical protein
MALSGEWFHAQAHNALAHRMGSALAMKAIGTDESPAASVDWASLSKIVAGVPVLRGYRLELLRPSGIPEFVAAVRAWFPAIDVGSASCFSREAFLRSRVSFCDTPNRDVLIVLIRKGDELAGLFSCERDRDALSLYARLGVVAPAHRGAGLSRTFPLLAEAIGRALQMEFAYGMATLNAPHVQRTFEAFEWSLVGITPGYDREMVAPGVVQRVYEAVYAKVLVADAHLLRPQAKNLTARTRDFFRMLFPRKLHPA